MQGPPPIRRGIYGYSFDDEPSAARFSDAARTFFIILYRLELIELDTAHMHTSSKWRLEKFGVRWFAPEKT